MSLATFGILYIILSVVSAADPDKPTPAICGKYQCGGSRLELPCACDDMCTVYGDCCADHPKLHLPAVLHDSDTSSLSVLPHPHIHCVDTLVDGSYFLVSECPADWSGEYVGEGGHLRDAAFVREMCETRDPGARKEYLIPTVASTTGLSYRNIFCGVCNGVELRALTMWSYDFDCSERLDIESFGDALTYVFAKRCDFAFTEKSRRWCSRRIEYGCGSSHVINPNQLNMTLTERRCLSYVDYVHVVVHLWSKYYYVYRNMDCVKCAALSTDRFGCYDAESDIRTMALSHLSRFQKVKDIDVKIDINITEEVSINCSREFLFYKWACRPLKCPTGYGFENDTRQRCVLQATQGVRMDSCVSHSGDGGFIGSVTAFAQRNRGRYNYDDIIMECHRGTEVLSYRFKLSSDDDLLNILTHSLSAVYAEGSENTSVNVATKQIPPDFIRFCNCSSQILHVTPGVPEMRFLPTFADHLSLYRWPFFINVSYMPAVAVGLVYGGGVKKGGVNDGGGCGGGDSGVRGGSDSGVRDGGGSAVRDGSDSGVRGGSDSGVRGGSDSGVRGGGGSAVRDGSDSGVRGGIDSGVRGGSGSGVRDGGGSAVRDGGGSGVRGGSDSGVRGGRDSGVRDGGDSGVRSGSDSGVRSGGDSGVRSGSDSGVRDSGGSTVRDGSGSGIRDGGGSGVRSGRDSGVRDGRDDRDGGGRSARDGGGSGVRSGRDSGVRDGRDDRDGDGRSARDGGGSGVRGGTDSGVGDGTDSGVRDGGGDSGVHHGSGRSGGEVGDASRGRGGGGSDDVASSGSGDAETHQIVTEICALSRVVCPLVIINKVDAMKIVDVELQDRVRPYDPTLANTDGFCRYEISDLQKVQRQRRDERLTMFLVDVEKWRVGRVDRNGGGVSVVIKWVHVGCLVVAVVVAATVIY